MNVQRCALRRRNYYTVMSLILALLPPVLLSIPVNATTIPPLHNDALVVSQPTPEESQAMDLRTRFGFDNDLLYIRSLEDSTSSTSTVELGIPLTASETAEMTRRREAGLVIGKIEHQFSALADYAGAWMDQAHGGIVVVAFTDKSESTERLAAIAAIMPKGSPFQVTDATYSFDTLNQMYEKISADQAADTKLQALHIVQSAIDTQNNRILVAVDKNAPADAEQAIATRYNFAGIVVSRGNMPTSSSSRDIRSGRTYGGLWTTDGSENCTIGYSDAKSTTEQTYSLTAGHCGPNGSTWIQGLGGSRTIGQVHANSTYGRSSTNCDCAPVGGLASGFGTSGAYITAGSVRLLTAAQTSPYQNEALCQFGAASVDRWGGIQCGNVAFASSTITEGGSPSGTFTLTDALQSNVRSTAGDSGGTYVDGNYLLAIQSATGDPNGVGGWVTWASKPANFGTAGIHLAFAGV